MTGARSCKSVESEVHRSPGGTLRELALVALGSLLAPAFRKPLPRRKRAPGSFSVASEPVFSRCMLGGVLQDRCGCMLQLCALSAFRSLSRSALVQLEVFLCALRGCWSKGRDRSFASIQVAGDTQLLQVFEHRGHWQHKLQFGCRDAQPAEGGSPSFPAAFEYLASFRSSQLPDQRASRGRQLCTSFGHGWLGVPRFLLGGSFAELLSVPSAPRASGRNSSRVVTEALKATMPDGAYPKTSLVDLA